MRRDQACTIATSSERGFVIVAVLWILAALAALAAIFSLYLSGSARALAVNDTALQAEALVSRTRAPVLNAPERVKLTGRAENAQRLGQLPNVVAPRIRRVSRAALTGFRKRGFEIDRRKAKDARAGSYVIVDNPNAGER